MKLKYIYTLLVVLLPTLLAAQISVTFEQDDYKSLGVYDTWEESPFRTGALNGNYDVIDNHLTYEDEMLGAAPNSSSKILAVQRSRFGSNTFGVRIDLKETFELTKETKYLHVMVHRPYGGRVMVVGLGKRRDRDGQTPDVEQFWAMSTTNIGADKWQDVVLPIKGNGGIDIYSLVVVPDCESPHNYDADAVCYIDNIEVNNDPASKFIYGYYPIIFDKSQVYTRTDRRLNGVGFASPGDGNQSVAVPTSLNTAYVDMTASELRARAGETLTPSFNYSGSWMHGYVYIDRNNNGKFDVNLNEDFTIKEGSDIMSFAFYGGSNDATGKNSAGVTLTGQARNVLNPPAFVLPSDLEEGYYRMRFKVDWNSVDAAGNSDQSNHIINNGGGILDIMLNVHGDYCNVNDANRNGEVLASDDTKLVKYQAPFAQPFTIKMNPEQGFEYAGVIIKYGYKLSGDSIVNDNIQWRKVRIERSEFDSNDMYTIPAEYMCGNVEIEGLFIEEGTYVEPEKPTRYETTKIVDGNFAEGTSWYTIQIGQQGYVLFDNAGASYIPLNVTAIDPENDAHLWCFVGNDEDGYKLYNKQAGASKVLAAPTAMMGKTGADSHPIMQPESALPQGYIALWNFEDSDDLGSTDVAYAYMYEVGYNSNKVNNRDDKLAFWNEGADAGSTLQIRFAMKSPVVGVDNIFTDDADAPLLIYDLMGRRVATPDRGLYIINGKKVYIK